MFKNIDTISGVSSRLGTFAGAARSRTVLAATVAAVTLGMTSGSFAAIGDITSIATKLTVGTSTATMKNVTAVGTSSQSQFFPDSKSYTLNYLNDVDSITSVVAGGITYNAAGQGTAIVRRSTGSPNDTIWEVGNGNGSSSTLTIQGPNLGGTSNMAVQKALSGNNLLVGADNVFSNMGNSVGDNTNIDRVDIMFPSTITASANAAFSVFDRGPVTDHDAFKIAAVTAVDSSGNPSNYGPLISFADGTWGKTTVYGPAQEDILRENDSIASDSTHPADSTGQPIGGVLIPTSNLVAAGTAIYGYSLFSADATGSGTQLVKWTDATYFPDADSTSTGGGLDPVGVLGVEYNKAVVPEPATAGLIMLGLGGALSRRSKRKQA